MLVRMANQSADLLRAAERPPPSPLRRDPTSDDGYAGISCMTSADGGRTWSKPWVVVDDKDALVNCISPGITRMKDGRLLLAYSWRSGGNGATNYGNCAKMVRLSTDEGKTWSERTRITPDNSEYHTGCHDRAYTLADGRVMVQCHTILAPVPRSPAPATAAPAWEPTTPIPTITGSVAAHRGDARSARGQGGTLRGGQPRAARGWIVGPVHPQLARSIHCIRVLRGTTASTCPNAWRSPTSGADTATVQSKENRSSSIYTKPTDSKSCRALNTFPGSIPPRPGPNACCRDSATSRARSATACIPRGGGQGGFILTQRFAVAAHQRESLAEQLSRTVLPAVAEQPGIVGTHLCLADDAASGVVTAEAAARAVPTIVPSWTVLIEGISADHVKSAGVAVVAVLADT